MTDIYPDDIRVEGENLALKRVLWGIIAVCVVAVLNGISRICQYKQDTF